MPNSDLKGTAIRLYLAGRREALIPISAAISASVGRLSLLVAEDGCLPGGQFSNREIAAAC